ncbi:dipeptidyl peptidase 3 isoform X2 [Anthonomus grandis grandis]|nr:dipeptidyl peptidase 3 isoform X2 [Anthonomus grandis grandis]XP_050299660.1 dipeptidyl peptidase 3 isoform X2 [Anthonomus grandis grandis]
MAPTVDKSQYVLPMDQPFVRLEIEGAFNGLSDQERVYAHHISKASWAGGLVTLLQTSPESAPIFVLLHKLFSAPKFKCEEFLENALKAGFTNEEVKAFYIYAAGVFANAGNYKGFGDTKIVPNIEKERLEQLLALSPIWTELKPIWDQVKDVIYDLGPGKTCLGFNPEGVTTYLSKNVTIDDTLIVQNWLKSKNMECYNTRLFKTEKEGKVIYEIRMASEEKRAPQVFQEGNITYNITYGDYSPLMGLVAKNLEAAVPHAANDTEKEMLKSYVSSFKGGDLEDHKTGSRYWIKDKSPAVENYIGFIETYRDPAGTRGEFEGFVAAVNRQMSEKFTSLVTNAETFLNLLPWNKDFEKDTFLKPDFTSLDVLTFAGSGIPAGINIPNYDSIRQTEGFKNVSLGNVIPASYQQSVTPFLSKEDADLLQKWRVPAFELQVGLHELLGHGSGKLLRKEADGTANFPDTLLDPFTGKPPATWYKPGDTYDTQFGPLGSTYEECRAEAVGLYLSLEPEVLKIFGHEGAQAEEVTYVNWLSLVWAGAGRGLESWEPGRGWLQAHAQARFVLSRVLIQAGVVKVTQPNDDDLLITLDRSAIRGAGRCAIGRFLLELQVLKATANVSAAEKLYNHYAEVTEPWLSWRSIVLAKKQPRKIFIQANTELGENGKVKLKHYEASVEGLIRSWVERFDNAPFIYEALLEQTRINAEHF